MGFGFDHHHAFSGTGDDKIKRAGSHLFERRVNDKLAVNFTNAGVSDGPEEWHARDCQCSRCCNHRQHVRIILHIVGEDRCDHLCFALEPRGEQRADRTIDQAGRQCFFFAWAGFTFEEATWNTASRIGFFLVVNRQWEEIEAGARCALCGHCTKHNGVAIGGEHRTVRLTGDTARFEREGTTLPLHFLADNIKHLCIFLPSGKVRRWP